MSFVVLRAGPYASLASDDPLVPAAALPAFADAISLLDGLAALAAQARAAGHADGLARGLADGRAQAAAELATSLADADAQLAAARAALRREAAGLAVAIVRRIAGGLGPADTVAALAETAAAALAPDPAAEVRVPAAALAATAARLRPWPRLVVVADPALAGDECEFRSGLGVVRAGLETQLAAILAGLGDQGIDDAA
jgi:flagellar assembly protein FliH